MNRCVVYIPYPFHGYWTVYENGETISRHCCAANAEVAASFYAEYLADRLGQPTLVKIQLEHGSWYVMGEFAPGIFARLQRQNAGGWVPDYFDAPTVLIEGSPAA